MIDKARILAVSKCDLADEELMAGFKKELKANAKKLKKIPIDFFSSATGKGVPELLDVIWKAIDG